MRLSTSVLVLLLLGSAAMAEGMKYNFEKFDAVEVSKGIEVEIQSGEAFSVIGDARRGKLDRLIVHQDGDTLQISRKTGWGLWGTGKRDRFHVTITMPELTEIDASAGSSVNASGTGISALVVKTSSGSTTKIDDLSGGVVTVQVKSGSTVVMTGDCTSLTADVRSGSTAHLKNLSCVSADLRSKSGSTLHARAEETAEVTAASGATVRLYGEAQITHSDVSSGASFSR